MMSGCFLMPNRRMPTTNGSARLLTTARGEVPGSGRPIGYDELDHRGRNAIERCLDETKQ